MGCEEYCKRLKFALSDAPQSTQALQMCNPSFEGFNRQNKGISEGFDFRVAGVVGGWIWSWIGEISLIIG